MSDPCILFLLTMPLLLGGCYVGAWLAFLPTRVFGRGEHALTADDFKQLYPNWWWMTDVFPFVQIISGAIGAIPAAAIGGKPWPLFAILLPLVGFPCGFLSMAVLEFGFGVSLLYPSKRSRQPVRVIVSPKMRKAGWFRLAVVAGVLVVAGGVATGVRALGL